jgi:hypothetical protein
MKNVERLTFTAEQSAAIPRLLLAISDFEENVSDLFYEDWKEELEPELKELDAAMRPFKDEVLRLWKERQATTMQTPRRA